MSSLDTGRGLSRKNESPTPGLDTDYSADAGREACKPPRRRKHRDYQRPRWATCHMDDVDKLFVAPGIDGAPKTRIDLDGVGAGMASLHDRDVNVNLSVWLDTEQVDELIQMLLEARKEAEELPEDDDGGEQ